MSETTTTTTVAVEPKPTHVVIDNSNLEAVLANARGEEPKPEEKAAEKPVETKAETKAEPEEDENGLTAEEKAALTEKMQRAIGKKHRAFKEAEEFGESQFREKQLALKRVEELERENARLRAQNQPVEPEAPKKPAKADFKTDEDFIEAMADWKAGEKLREKEVKDHAKAVEDRNREMLQAAQARIAKAKEIVPDFEEVMNVDTPLPEDVAGYMQESDLFAEIGYHLAKNPEVLERISKMTPAKQLVEIGKIEGTLKPFAEKSAKAEDQSNGEKPSQNGKQETAPSTNAKASKARPEPIKPLETGSAAQVEKPESEMTYEEAKAHWAKTHKVDFKARKRH